MRVHQSFRRTWFLSHLLFFSLQNVLRNARADEQGGEKESSDGQDKERREKREETNPPEKTVEKQSVASNVRLMHQFER